MMRTPDFARLPLNHFIGQTDLEHSSNLRVGGTWRVRARDRRTGLIVAQRFVKNKWTNYGLTGLASGLWNPTGMYLAVENFYNTLTVQANIGDGVVTLTGAVHTAGDTQLVLSPGKASQETVTFSSAVTHPDTTVTYTLSGTVVNTHVMGDPVCRAIAVGDTVSTLQGEQQYDSTNFPNQRMQSPGGYSNGTGNFVVQFYYPGPTLEPVYIMNCGICDTATIGTGNLWNHFTLGFNNNNSANDLEIDGSLTLSNA